MRGLYAIVDVESLERRGLDPVRFAGAVIEARPAAVQLRDKARGARAALQLLRAVVPIAREAGVLVYANDRPDLALLAGCDGVHVGQDDLPVSVVRSLAEKAGRADLRVGLSTHDEAQIEALIAPNATSGPWPDYVAVGPVYATSSKERPSPVVGIARLASLARRLHAVRAATPVIAIGGITIDRATEIAGAADVGAVIAALLPEDGRDPYADVTARARALHAALSSREGTR